MAGLLLVLGCGAPAKETVVWKSVGGQDLQADIYRPDGKGNGRTLLWIHGGALMHGSREEIPQAEINWWVEHGYRLALIDYRLAPETRLPGILEDLQDAASWARQKGPELFGVDPERVVMVGQSAGAYLALASGFAVNPKPPAIVAFYGYARVDGEWATGIPVVRVQTPRTDLSALEAVVSEPLPGGLSAEVHMVFDTTARASGQWTQEVVGDACDAGDAVCVSRFNPLDQVDGTFPATVLIHGEADLDVPLEESSRMAQRLEDAQVEHALVKVPGRGHGFDLQGTLDPAVTDSFEQVHAFLERTVSARE